MIDVIKDLKNIANATISYLGEEYIGDVFGGIVSLNDFACYVYFEYCSAIFLNQQEKKSVNQHCIQFEERLPTDYEDPKLKNLSDDDINYLFSFAKGDALSRNVLRSIKQMLENRNVTDRKKPDVSSVRNALAGLKEFQDTGEGGRLRKMPMTKGYFYQALVDSVIGNEHGQIFKWMALSRSSKEKYLNFYLKLYRFIRLFMIGNYNSLVSDDELDTYISQAIAICKLEERNKFNSILNFANEIICHDKNYFKKHKNIRPFRNRTVPPCFFGTVHPWDNTHQCPNTILLNIFGRFTHRINLIDKPAIYPSPVLYYNQYLNFFIKADADSRKIEEYRYYTIIVLAEFIRLKIVAKEISVDFSNARFAWFIHNHYNIFDIYKTQCNKDLQEILTYDVIKRIRLIVSDMLPPKKRSSSEPAAIIPPS